MLFMWHFTENPYKENLFRKARIPTSETRAGRINVVLQNYGLSHLRDRLLQPDQRFAEELLAHRAHSLDRKPMEGFIRDFDKIPIDLAQLEAAELKVVDLTKLVVLPEKGIDPQALEAAFTCPSLGVRETFDEEVYLDY